MVGMQSSQFYSISTSKVYESNSCNPETTDANHLLISTRISITQQQKKEKNTQFLIQGAWHCQPNMDEILLTYELFGVWHE